KTIYRSQLKPGKATRATNQPVAETGFPLRRRSTLGIVGKDSMSSAAKTGRMRSDIETLLGRFGLQLAAVCRARLNVEPQGSSAQRLWRMMEAAPSLFAQNGRAQIALGLTFRSRMGPRPIGWGGRMRVAWVGSVEFGNWLQTLS